MHEYPDRPIPGMGAIIFKADSVLLVRRLHPPRAGEWTIPGGKQELGETIEQTAARELMEETGIVADLLGTAAVLDLIHRDEAGRIQFHYLIVDFWGEWRSGELVAGDDAADARWVPLSDLTEVGLADKTVALIQQVAERRALARATAPGL